MRGGRLCLSLSMFSLGFGLQAAADPRWPFADTAPARVMNTISSFQTYGHKPGFHHGLDIAAAALSEAYAPVSGKLSARYYYPPHPSDYTFEISITQDDGSRWELHHIDKSTIPAEILGRAERNDNIEAGTYLGKIFDASAYGLQPHLHINLIKNGFYHEPLKVLPRPEDRTPPVIAKVYHVSNGQAEEIGGSVPAQIGMDGFLVVEMYDPATDGKRLPVHRFEVADERGRILYGFDFSKLPYEDFLRGPDEIYHVPPFRLPSGENTKTTADVFYYRVPAEKLVPSRPGPKIQLKLEARDLSGHATLSLLTVRPK